MKYSDLWEIRALFAATMYLITEPSTFANGLLVFAGVALVFSVVEMWREK